MISQNKKYLDECLKVCERLYKKISNKQDLMNFPKSSEENKIPNLNNSSLKDLEIKYLKELATRKFNIDKILKEQEDDND